MGILIKPTDFTGKYAVAQDPQSSVKLQLYIDKYEEEYLRDLLGIALFALFKAQVSGFTVAAGIYKNLYDPIYQDDGTCVRKSSGIKNMLLGFLYFEFVRDQAFKNTQSGMHKDNTELGAQVGFDYTTFQTRYNESIDNYETIQWYINENTTVYPDYNGQPKGRVHWSL